MRIQDFVIGIMAFGVLSIVLFASSIEVYDNLENRTGITITINESYTSEFQTFVSDRHDDTIDLSNDISSNSPGGSEGEISTEEADFGIGSGLKAASQIFKAPGLFKKTIMGTGDTPGLGSRLGIRSEFLNFAIAAFILIVSIILISSILRNKL